MSRAELGGGGSPRRERTLAAGRMQQRCGVALGRAPPALPSKQGVLPFQTHRPLICSVFCPYLNSAALTSLCRTRISFPPPVYVAVCCSVSRQQRRTRRRNYSSVRMFARQVAVALLSVLSEGLVPSFCHTRLSVCACLEPTREHRVSRVPSCRRDGAVWRSRVLALCWTYEHVRVLL